VGFPSLRTPASWPAEGIRAGGSDQGRSLLRIRGNYAIGDSEYYEIMHVVRSLVVRKSRRRSSGAFSRSSGRGGDQSMM
jgi:hypothetical protein